LVVLNYTACTYLFQLLNPCFLEGCNGT
jgi:hypothetical protein